MAAPWYLYEALYNPLFWTSFVHHETLARVVRHLEDETQPGWYTLHGFWKEVHFLWPLILPAGAFAMRDAAPNGAGRVRQRREPVEVDQPCDEPLDRVAGRRPGRGLRSADQAAVVCPAGVCADGAAGGNAGRARAGISRSDENRGGGLGRAGAGADTRPCAGALARDRATRIIVERLRSTPSYAMGLEARRTAALRDGGHLYFAGVELPTLVYYSAMHVEFIKAPGGLEPITDPGAGEPPRLDPNDLALVDSQGDLVPIANLSREWDISGPERASR